MRINENLMASNAARNLTSAGHALGASLEKLSSGFRINRAADDAAGLVISQGLRAQASGLRQATRNAEDGISVVQTAEGALNEVHTMLGRMRYLAVQAANSGANDAASRAASQAEIRALSTEITRVASSTRFGGINLLDGTYGGAGSAVNTGSSMADGWFAITVGDQFTIAVGATAPVTVHISQSLSFGAGTAAVAAQVQHDVDAALTAAGSTYAGKVAFTPVVDGAGTSHFEVHTQGVSPGQQVVLTDTVAGGLRNGLFLASPSTSTAGTGTGGVFQVGANANETVGLTIASMASAALGVDALDVTSDGGASTAITTIDSAISTVSSTRGNLGALQNRFESMINNLQATAGNLDASESRIRDTDMATEMVTFTRNNVLVEAGTAMLSQSMKVPDTVLQLLR
jgi:flagellin